MGTNNIKMPAVFLDRDGTVIFIKNYLNSPKQVRLYHYAADSINRLRAAGFKVIIVTNQSGVTRRMFTEHDLQKIHEKFVFLLKNAGAEVDAIYYCPHTDEDFCNCRKPKPGMVLQGAKDFNINLEKSYTVGDSIRDYLLGCNVGGKGILVLTGHGKKQQTKIVQKKNKPMAVCKTLKEAVSLIIKDVKKM
ncbi:MAG: HAD family hydrolase [Endomicrobium sp.]|nr:HAD family hydrolase [Endomicrobium sp.]